MRFVLNWMVIGGLLSAANTWAAVIDFQSLEHLNAQVASHGFVYVEDGYQLSNLNTLQFPFATWGTLSPEYPGSTALFNNTVDGVTVLTQIAPGGFDLLSIDLDFLNGPISNAAEVTFTGNLIGGGTVVQSFTTDAALGLQTFNFVGFTNLASVTWVQASPFHQFDNIVVQPTAIVNIPVPEPASLLAWSLIAGLGLAGYRRRLK